MNALLCRFICRILCCVYLQSGCLWRRWRSAASYSCCWLVFVGVSVVPTPAAATSAAGAALTHAAALDTVSINTHTRGYAKDYLRCLKEVTLNGIVCDFCSIRGR